MVASHFQWSVHEPSPRVLIFGILVQLSLTAQLTGSDVHSMASAARTKDITDIYLVFLDGNRANDYDTSIEPG